MPSIKHAPNQNDSKAPGDILTGSCLCGSVQVTITDPSIWTKPHGHLCDSGSYLAANLDIDQSKTHIEDRLQTLKMYVDVDCMSGRQMDSYFCSNCGSPIASITALLPGRVTLKAGIFPQAPAPEGKTFALHRASWQGSHEEVVQWKIKAGERRI